MDIVFSSCNYQAKLLESIGISVDKVVYEPVNEHLFYPANEKKNWVVAVSSTIHVKNIGAIFAYHETCCRTAMESLLSGVDILAGKHPIFSEYPCVASGLTPSECVETLKVLPEVDSEC